jgi:AcrR family transcriptional regulator
LDTLRPQLRSAAGVPGELIILGLSGAFDATYMRSIWDATYGLGDLLLAHLWLYLAVQAAVSGEVDIDARLARYDDLIREVVTQKPEVLSSLEAQGSDHVRGRILHAATIEFMTNGYEGAHVSTITQEAGVTPYVFYANFASKAQLLAECFSFSVKCGAALVESQLAGTSDLAERHLRLVTGTVGAQVLGADALALVRVQGMRGESDLRKPLEEAWATVVSRISRDLTAMRPHASPTPPVPDELTALGLLGAFDSLYMRSTWDDTYTMTGLLSAHLWLFLVVQAAMSGEIDVASRLPQYVDLVREVAAREADVDTVFAGS